MIDVTALTQLELHELVRWFAYHMPMEQRGELMAAMPVAYAKMHPGVDPAAVLRAVAEGLNKAETGRRDRQAAQADEATAAGRYPVG